MQVILKFIIISCVLLNSFVKTRGDSYYFVSWHVSVSIFKAILDNRKSLCFVLSQRNYNTTQLDDENSIYWRLLREGGVNVSSDIFFLFF